MNASETFQTRWVLEVSSSTLNQLYKLWKLFWTRTCFVRLEAKKLRVMDKEVRMMKMRQKKETRRKKKMT